MQDSQPTGSARLGFGLLIALLALFASGKAILFDSLDPDCFWHLRVAAQLHRDGIGPIVDDLSFASDPKPWTPYSWLAELAMKAVWDMGGYRAAVATAALMQAAIVVLLAGCCLSAQQSRRYLTVVIATAIGSFLILPYLSFRPVTAGFVLLFLIVWLILKNRATVWLIIPLTVLLTNIHLFSFFVPAICFEIGVGALLERDAKQARRYAILSCLTLLACMATPMLPGLIKTIFYYSAQDKMVTGPVISEMQSFARGPMGWIAAAGAVAMLICIGFGFRLLAAGHLICIAAAALLMLKLGRFAPLFALAACPALAATLPGIKDRLLARTPVVVLLMVIAVLCAGRLIFSFPKSSTTLSQWVNRHGPDAPGYPCAAADYVDQSVARHTGHLINEFNWGGYLAWRLAGKYQVLLDGRTQVFSQSLWQATYLGDEPERKDFLSKIHADAAVVPANKSKFRSVLIQLGWTRAYVDGRAEVLVPP